MKGMLFLVVVLLLVMILSGHAQIVSKEFTRNILIDYFRFSRIKFASSLYKQKCRVIILCMLRNDTFITVNAEFNSYSGSTTCRNYFSVTLSNMDKVLVNHLVFVVA